MAVLAPAAPFALDAETVGLILLLVVCFFAITIIDATRPGIVSAAGSVPLVGGGLKSWIDGAIGGARAWLYNTMKGGLVAFSATVDWLHTLAAQLADTLAGFGELTWTAVWKIDTVALPALEARALAAGAALGAQIRSEVLALVSAEEAAWRAAVGAVEAEVQTAEQQALAYAAAVGVETATEARALFAAAEADASALIKGVEGEISTAFAVAEADARGWVVEGVRAVEGEIAAVRDEVGAGVSALEREVAGAQSSLRALIAQLSAAGALVGAGVLTEAIADVIRLKNLRCIQNCDPLSNLADFSAALDAGALIAFALAWREDQASAHPTFAPLIARTTVDLEQGVKSLVGG